MSLSLLSSFQCCLIANLIINCLPIKGQVYGDPYSSTVNRYGGYRGGNPGYGGQSKYPFQYNSQYYDPTRPILGSPDPSLDANYWRNYRDRYPPTSKPTSAPFQVTGPGYSNYPPTAYPPPPLTSALGPPSLSSSMPGSMYSSQSPIPSPNSLSPSSASSPSNSHGQPNFDSKYGLLPGPANFADSTVVFDHRYGWVPRYPSYALPPSSNYFPSVAHPYSYPNHRIVRAVAEIRGSDKVTGTVNFEQEENDQVIIRGKIVGLPPGAHGMHILEKPLTGNDCASGGDHYNPQKTEHGGKHDWVRHVGDLGNIFADRDGIAYFDLTDQIISITGGYSVLNRTLVITEKPDDLGRSGDPESKRNGNSGNGIACGLIQLAKF